MFKGHCDDVHIKSVKELNLTQTLVMFSDTPLINLPAIVNEKVNSLTAVSKTSNQSVVIITQLVAVFFENTDSDESSVAATGKVILDYATKNTKRRRRRRELTVSFDTNNRKLNLNEEEAPFKLSSIKIGLDVSASGLNLFWMRGLSFCGFILSLAVNFL